MCGIAGYIQRAAPEQAVIQSMLARLVHRGPDAAGVWQDMTPGGHWHVVLGHRRLSILDIEGSAQPMSAADDRTHITFNGEIYNFEALRADLSQSGQSFATRGDTEVALHHLARHGTAGLRRLNGMFAIGLWDSGSQALLLARDRAGIKPLYWASLPCGGIAFASELMALATHPDISHDVCPDAFAHFLFRDYVPPPRTMLKSVFKLSPGQWLRWDASGGLDRGTYWKPPSIDPSLPGNAAELGGLLETAVRSQLVADVPVGVFLSGGIDSSLVAAIAQRQSPVPLRTFSMGFDDPTFDESASAALVARHIGSEHFHQTVSDATMLDALDDALAALDEPIGDHSIVPTFLVSKLAARHVKVALGGDGSDELFAGYPTYLAHRVAGVYAAVPKALRSSLIDPAIRSFPAADRYQSLGWKLKRFALRWDDSPLLRHQRWMSSTDLPLLGKLLAPESTSSLPDTAGGPEENDFSRYDFQTYLPGSVLTKVDRASMARSLEVRPPFLDNDVIDYAMRLSPQYKVRGRTTKWILKQAAGAYLPREIIFRRKQGFSVPLARWLRGPLRSRAAEAVAGAEAIDGATARSLLAAHMSAREDHSKTLWSLIVFDSWQRRLRACRAEGITCAF